MKSTNFLIIILSLILFSCTEPEDADELISKTNVTEFTVNGKTYIIGTTRWSTVLNTITTDEGQKGNLLMSLPDDLKLGTYKLSDGYIMIGYDNLPGYQAVYDKVDVTITKIGSENLYGMGILQGTFNGTFIYYETDANNVAIGGGEVQISGKFNTSIDL